MKQESIKELLLIKEKTKRIPIIVITDNVLHPNLYLPLEDITLDLDKKTITSAVNNFDGYFVVSTQMDSNPDKPMVYQMGTLCKITQHENKNKKIKIEYTALFKYKISKMEILTDGRFADGELQTEEILRTISDEEWKLHDETFDKLISYLKIFKEKFYIENQSTFLISSEYISPSELISICFINLNMNVVVKQSILETQSYLESFKTIIQLLDIGLGLSKDNQAPSSETEDETKLITRLNSKKMPLEVRNIVNRESKRMTSMPTNSSEYHTIENYLSTLCDYPWEESSDSTIDIQKTQDYLNKEHFGLDRVKRRILRQLATQQLTNKKNGIIICLDGPPGVGKTSICKSIADSLNRKFVRIGLGGVSDESEIRGHRKTYVGAMTGKIVNAIIKSKVNNPLIVLDEIDKVGSSQNKGSVESALLEVLDPEQNTAFNDHFMNTPVDLSNVLFIATSNNIGNISQPLRDRMEIINIESYTFQEKFHIAKNHLIPKEKAKLGLVNFGITFSDSAIKKLILSYTRESGVRGLSKVITEIYQHCAEKFILERISEIKITDKNLNQFLDRKEIPNDLTSAYTHSGIVAGLAWTSVGGEVLLVESLQHNGNGKLSVTGQLGDVMKESAQIALSLIKSISEKESIKFDFSNKDIHIHFPAGATPKDGPSAGITLLSSLYSLINDKKVNSSIAMTGEISLRGEILPVGGIKEKLIGAHKNNKKLIFIPYDNKNDIDDIPAELKKDKEFKIKLVKHYSEVLPFLFEESIN